MHQYCVVIINKVEGLHSCYYNYNQEFTHKVCTLTILLNSTTKQNWCVVVVVCRLDNACKV